MEYQDPPIGWEFDRRVSVVLSGGTSELTFRYGQEALVADSGAYSYGMAFADVANLKREFWTRQVESRD